MDNSKSPSKSQRRGSEADAGPTPFQGRVPRQQTLSPQNGANGTSARSLSSPHPASATYIHQSHAVIDRHLQAFREERALWHLERQELHDRISQLESTLRRYQSISSSQFSSSPDRISTSRQSGSWKWMSTNGSRDSSAGSTGDEVWRGSSPTVKPTRTFSESSDMPLNLNQRLSSIAENVNQDGAQKVFICPRTDDVRKPSISGSQIDKNLDGINFKPSGLAHDIVKRAVTSTSPSPSHSPSPSCLSPNAMAHPRIRPLPVEDLKTDPYTIHAGHTPMADHSRDTLDGNGSGPSSHDQTPTGPEEEVLPIEPPTTAIRPPSERHDSYFPAVGFEKPAEGDPDPELQGPLGLTNEPHGDNKFLSELDTKLLNAVRDNAHDPSSSSADGPGEEKSEKEPGSDFEQPEQEPKLRIKRSMNFGMPLGASNCRKAA